MPQLDYKVNLFVGEIGQDITNLVELKKDFRIKEFSLENATEIVSPDLTFNASKKLSLLTGDFLTSINGHFITIEDLEGRSLWAGFIDDIKETASGFLQVRSKSIIGTLANLNLKTSPPLVFDGLTYHTPGAAILAIYDGTGLDIPAKYIDRQSFIDVDIEAGERISFLFDESTKALEAMQEIMLSGGFLIYTHQNVFKAKIIERDPVKFTIEDNELIGLPEYSFKRDEVKSMIKGSQGGTPLTQSLSVADVVAIGERPFIIKRDVENIGSNFVNIANRILDFYGTLQNQNALTTKLRINWLTEDQKSKYYILEMFDPVSFHTEEIFGKGIVVDKETVGTALELTLRCYFWKQREPTPDAFKFEGNKLVFDGLSNLIYEIYIDNNWQAFPLKRFQSLDISNFIQPVLIRYRLIIDGEFTIYKYLRVLSDEPGFVVGTAFFEELPTTPLTDEIGDPLLYSWGAEVVV